MFPTTDGGQAVKASSEATACAPDARSAIQLGKKITPAEHALKPRAPLLIDISVARADVWRGTRFEAVLLEAVPRSYRDGGDLISTSPT